MDIETGGNSNTDWKAITIALNDGEELKYMGNTELTKQIFENYKLKEHCVRNSKRIEELEREIRCTGWGCVFLIVPLLAFLLYVIEHL